MMTQFVHKISNSYIDLPTDYWVPTTERLHPMRSGQLAVGAYYQPTRHWLLSLEGYYKESNRLLQYANWLGLEPPADAWDTKVSEGRGRFYGVEADVRYQDKRLKIDAAYTLSWNRITTSSTTDISSISRCVAVFQKAPTSMRAGFIARATA